MDDQEKATAAIDEAEELLTQAINALYRAHQVMPALRGVIEGYTAGNLRQWIDADMENQPGCFADLRHRINHPED